MITLCTSRKSGCGTAGIRAKPVWNSDKEDLPASATAKRRKSGNTWVSGRLCTKARNELRAEGRTARAVSGAMGPGNIRLNASSPGAADRMPHRLFPSITRCGPPSNIRGSSTLNAPSPGAPEMRGIAGAAQALCGSSERRRHEYQPKQESEKKARRA